MWEQAPGQTLANPSLLPSLCVRCVSMRGLCICHGLPDGSRVFLSRQASIWPSPRTGLWAWLSISALGWSLRPPLTHMHRAPTLITYIQFYAHMYVQTRKHACLWAVLMQGRRCCFISRAPSLQCPRFPADCRISPRHQRTRFSSWSRTKRACCTASHFWDVFHTHICLFFIISCHLFLGSEWQPLSCCFSWSLCGPCGILPKLWRRQGLLCMKCWWAGWAS